MSARTRWASLEFGEDAVRRIREYLAVVFVRSSPVLVELSGLRVWFEQSLVLRTRSSAVIGNSADSPRVQSRVSDVVEFPLKLESAINV